MEKVGISGVSIQQIREFLQNAIEISFKKIAPRTAGGPILVSSKEWRADPKIFGTYIYMISRAYNVILYLEYDETELAGTIEIQSRWGAKGLFGSGVTRRNPSEELWTLLAIEDAFGSHCTRISEVQAPGDEPVAVRSASREGRASAFSISSFAR